MAHAETYASYTSFVRSTMAPGARDKQLEHFGLGLIGELGEVSEPLKKHLYGGKELDRSKLLKEMGDVVWYVFAIAEASGIELEDGMAKERSEDGINYLVRKSKDFSPVRIGEIIFAIASFVGGVADLHLGSATSFEACSCLTGILECLGAMAHQHLDSDLGEVIDINVTKLSARMKEGYYESYGVANKMYPAPTPENNPCVFKDGVYLPLGEEEDDDVELGEFTECLYAESEDEAQEDECDGYCTAELPEDEGDDFWFTDDTNF